MEFKDRLIKLRKELNLTQEELAQKIGYTRTAISAWEIGRNEPSNADTIKLAKYFGVSTDYLLGKSDIRNPEELKNIPHANSGGVDTTGLDEEDLKELQAQADYMKWKKQNKNENKDKNEDKK